MSTLEKMMCRICERQSNLMKMNPNSIQLYLMCGNVSFDIDDNLPQELCRFCITQMLHIAKFRAKSEETYKKFKDLLQSQISTETNDFNEIDDDDDMSDFDDDNSIIFISANEPLDCITQFNNSTNNDATDTDEIHLDNHKLVDSKNITEIQHSNEVIAKTSVSDTKRIAELKFKCDICETEIESIETLELHMNKFHRMATNLRQCERCDWNSKWFTIELLSAHIIQMHTKSFKCANCNKCFQQKSHLIKHLKSHTSKKPYKSQHCAKVRKDRHTKVHTGEKPYKCDYCDKCFSQKQSLTTHNRVHTGEKPYKCDYCDKCFSQKQSLTTHNRVHTGEKPYKCDYCDKCFSLKYYLKTHNRVHTGEKPYKCDYCNKYFSEKGYLKTHNRVHTGEKPYKCDYCNKYFSEKGYLKKHNRVHTGEKPYKCDYCHKCFAQKSNLNKHSKALHKGEKPRIL